MATEPAEEKRRYERREMRGGGQELRGLGRRTNEGKHGANLGGGVDLDVGRVRTKTPWSFRSE